MRPTVRIVPFDVHKATEADFTAYYRVAAASQEIDRPDEPPATCDDIVNRLKNPFVGFGAELIWIAYEHDNPVAIVTSDLPEDANSHIAVCYITVHPQERRRGIGTEVLRGILAVLRAQHRTLVEGWELSKGGPGELWARAIGFDVANTMYVQSLTFADVDHSRWDIPAPDGYHLQQWSEPAPQDLITSYARARTAAEDVPGGESTYRPPTWTPERVRKTEAEFEKKGIEHRVVVAVDNVTGEVAGLTEIERYSHRPLIGFQRDTAVLAAHRGRGLGAAMKAHMLRWLIADHPDTEKIISGTNELNIHMRRVNAQMGFTTTRVVTTVHQNISVLEAALAAR
ncbi:GNAT family N-acetyltransferase [Lentzea sp. NPDC004782]|uniref:GNAT family N-acetyltransferase n=1 Tax=Lentzea sp. NPDC004782 TaxID=3154458 RepID=UPI0033A251B5